ncbi:hypothetical protein LOAG_05912, partial [Loa loa]
TKLLFRASQLFAFHYTLSIYFIGSLLCIGHKTKSIKKKKDRKINASFYSHTLVILTFSLNSIKRMIQEERKKRKRERKNKKGERAREEQKNDNIVKRTHLANHHHQHHHHHHHHQSSSFIIIIIIIVIIIVITVSSLVQL